MELIVRITVINMSSKMIDKEMIGDIGRYLFDGILLTAVWAKTNLTLLNVDALWADTFGEYAKIIKLSIQVIITVLIAITAFYRMLREIKKYKQNKKDKQKE